jgi:regulator of sigma E protease
VGIVAPFSPAVIGDIAANSAAAASGLAKGDMVLNAAGKAVADALGLREHIRATPEEAQVWRVQRGGQVVDINITPARVAAQSPAPGEPTSIGRIGAVVGAVPELQTVRHGLWDGLSLGVTKTIDTAALSLRLLGKMLVGEASIKNLSGPITIADYAGKSAQLGVVALLGFMALVSVSLGVLNLLPLPMLDGGHLMYYLWEGIVGKPVSEVWQQRLQQGGVAVLLLMMSVALFNDVSRLLG